MAFSYACVTLQRFVLPLVLVLAALVRPIGISFVYLLMFFISPFIPVATAQNFKGSVTAYLIILISLSTLLLLGHIGLQVAILALDLESIFGSCSFTEQLLRHIGFIDLFKLQLYAIIEWLVPEVVVFCTSIAIYVVIKNITTETSDVASQAELGEGLNLTEDVAADVAPTTSVVPRPKPKKSSRPLIQINFDPLVKIAPMFCLATLFFSAVLRPSVPGGFYFMFFLLSGTYWATFQSLKRGFAILIRFVMVVLVLHTLSIVSYQTPWVQQNLDNSTLPARLVGLEPLITSTCAKDIRYLNYDTTFKLDSFLSPIVMLFSYYVLALTSKNIINMRSVTKPLSAFGQLENGTKISRQISLNTRTTNANKKDSWSKSQRLNMSNPSNHRKSEPTETTPLVRHKKSIPIERNIESIRTESDIPMDLLDNGVDVEKGPSVFDQISYGIVSVGGFIYQNSYIFTNILMMAWSIVYHSWLTFVFLLWANVLWMIPNQRKAMMRSSPFIVLYAELLLIAQYIYGMNLTNDELPSSVNTTGINLQQIGLERPSENNVQPCVPLITKTSFLLMFWVTLRQFFKEKNERKRHSTLADMVAPLQVTVGTATADLGATQESKKTSKFLKKAGDIIKNLLVRLWIWLLILVIFLCAITGVKMTGFRICYMAMFLFFLLVFQSSSKAWVKIMYGFWLFLIFYAMSILTLIYTYQFDKFDEYWDHYLNISKTLQEDIGLKKYETKDLFLHLVSPTIIVILTVIQVHYFHRRFIAALQQQATESKSAPRAAVESEPADTSLRESSHLRDYRTSFTEESGFQESLKDLFRRLLTIIKKRSKYMAKHFKGVCWRFLELHLIKAVYISAFVCCVSEVCVLHIPFCLLCIVGLVSRNKIQIFISRIISLSVSVIILTKMIYQVQYISHDKYNVVCNSTGTTENNAVWFGLQKATVNGGLMDLIKKYIIFMVMVTLHAVVTLRQNQMRHIQGDHSQRGPPILFPSVTRADAEKNLEGLIQYLFNYGFYKFGMECTLICLVALISYRQDIVALLYVVWLCGILWLPRRSCARIWGFFQCFTATIIFLEYIVLVGIPPGLCIEYPWLNSIYSNPLQKWAMLPGDLNYSHVKKLIFDFIMLLFISRQKRVFASELRIVDNNFPGGTNASVIKDIEQLGQVPFVNPTRDFLSTIRNYLDVIKNGVLCGFFWVTLSVVFVAGTNISDLLAVGYLIGAFVFLWEGSDFYLRPIRVILRRWNLLLLFNVFNIALKTFLQIGGCLFMKNLKHHACWLIHMLGITCALDVDSMLDTDDNDCPGLRTQSYLVWDATCFAFIVLQLRIFQSHYFCHIINDMKANALLAYRGAEIIEDLRQKQIEHRRKHEQEVLRKIKRKMEKIRATQQKMLRPIDKPTHFDEHGFPIPGYRAYRRKDHTTHVQAIRAGDYYMFDDMDEKFELDLIDDEVDFLEQEGKIDESEKKMTRRKNLFEVCKEITEDRKKSFSRQRSYASAPGSRIGIKSEQPDMPRASVISDPLVYPDSCTGDDHEKFEKPKTGHKSEAPSTSKGEVHEEQEDTEKKDEADSAEETEKESSREIDPPNPILRLLEGFMVSVVIRLNRFSRNYRYVMKILAEEKKALKESKKFASDSGIFNVNVSTPVPIMKKQLISDDEASITIAQQTSQSNTEIHDTTTDTTTTTAVLNEPLVDLNEIQLDTTDAPIRKDSDSIASLSKHTGRRSSGVPGIRVMPPSIELGLDETGTLSEEWSSERPSRPADFSYEEEDFASRDHHIIIEAIISSYYAVLANTDLICYIVVFINQVINASLISLPLPLMVFLWGTLSLPRPTKTFWITLIAYTQALIVIKCIFQFKLIWANYINLPNQPLSAAKIIGVALDKHFANYDLLLLLVLFVHRFGLKSQGLWKSEYKGEVMQEQAMREDNDKIQNDESAIVLAEDSSLSVAKVDEYQTTDSNSNESEEYMPGISTLTKNKYAASCKKFFKNLIHKTRLPADVYALMFMCDFINFFVLLFGFTAFGSQHGEGGVQTYLVENKVPIPFLIMLLVQFILIVIDRALYLRKALVHKIIFHFFSVIGIHIWMFFVIPAVTERSFYSLAPPIIFYIIKCFYLLLSAYQIKCGYPKRILGNFLTKGFSMMNMISFRCYMQIPFLYELRTILDWVCTDTTMTLFDWLKMEDIFSDIYFIKCGRQMEEDFPAMRGEKKAMFSKIMMGGCIIFLIVVSIWGPLCLFALGNAVGQPNLPYEVTASVRIGPYDPIYDTNNRESIFSFDATMFQSLQNAYKKDRLATLFLTNYDESDIAAIVLKANAPSMWGISPPDKERLLDDLIAGRPLICRFRYSFTRIPPVKNGVGTISDEVTHEFNETFVGREDMIAMLQGTAKNNTVVVIPFILPKFLKVHNSGELNAINQLMPNQEVHRPLGITLHTSQNASDGVWWEINDICDDPFYKQTLSKLPYSNCSTGVVMYTFNDKKFPSTFSFLTAGGIIGLYTTFVLLASRVLKSFICDQNGRIMYEDLPYVDRVLQLCLDIYLVREALEFALEEDLFAKLLFLYRSPETMIKWTRPKEETVDDETDTESLRSKVSHRRLE